ncbi:MAG: NUDIX hydrolase [Acidimicrobiales bacterium]|nr:MAG: NUDIX hydrolase [Acidimicrobiales bacterium]
MAVYGSSCSLAETGAAMTGTGQEASIRAAGVVVLDSPAEATERRFLAVHRPHRHDWSLPKGKVDPGETTPCTAVRECDEETGYRVVLGARLPSTHYVSGDAHKSVDYWVGHVRADEGFAPDEEVDEIRWVPVSEASAFLTYSDDAAIVRLAAGAPSTTPLIILRHAKAIRRGDFDGGDDADRPLSGRGRGEAKTLVNILDAYGIERVYSSPFKRCISTVSRFAKTIDTKIHLEPALGESGHESDPEATAARVRELLDSPAPTVLCTHRPVLPTVISSLGRSLGLTETAIHDDLSWDSRLAPGAMIVVHRERTDAGPRALAVEQHQLAR